jgi:hypothetical protein
MGRREAGDGEAGGGRWQVVGGGRWEVGGEEMKVGGGWREEGGFT